MFDGNGNWTSDFSAQADRDNGIKILAGRFDNIFIADIKESFENCLTKDGQITPIGNFNMGGQRITNVANGVNSGDAVNMSQLDTTVKLTGDQTIAGTKTFNESPIVPTPATSDNSTKAASTAFVKNNFSLLTGLPKWNSAISTTASTYTVPSRGWLFVEMAGSSEDSTVGYAYINNKEVGYILSRYGRSVGDSSIFIPVNTGDVLTFSGNINTGLQKIFYPAN